MAENGYQIIYYAEGETKDVAIRGHNQDGHWVEWRGQSDERGVVRTDDWWWKGPVQIVYSYNNQQHEKNVLVPEFGPGNWAHIYPDGSLFF